VMKPYVTDMGVFRCPADDRNLWESSGTSYLWNWKLNGQKLAAARVAFVSKGIIDEPSRIMVMGDKEGFHPHLDNKVNVLYADGHASNELTFLDETPTEK
jgi:prepilin-type processing-associated H-X9-DG protein